MNEILLSPVFGVLLSLVAFEAGVLLNRKTGFPLFNPLLIGIIITIAVLKLFHIEYSDYQNGGKIISFFLAPATVSLALPLYKMFHLFKKNALPVILGIIFGSTAGITSIILLSRLFGLTDELTLSLIPKSITTPIGMALAEQLGGVPAITVIAIILTGISGAILGPLLSKMSRLDDPIAMGVAMGCSSHAIGTAKAMELGETEGAMSSLTIALAGISTVLLAPLIWNILS